MSKEAELLNEIKEVGEAWNIARLKFNASIDAKDSEIAKLRAQLSIAKEALKEIQAMGISIVTYTHEARNVVNDALDEMEKVK